MTIPVKSPHPSDIDKTAGALPSMPGVVIAGIPITPGFLNLNPESDETSERSCR